MQLWRLGCGTTTIIDIRRLKVKFTSYFLTSFFFNLSLSIRDLVTFHCI